MKNVVVSTAVALMLAAAPVAFGQATPSTVDPAVPAGRSNAIDRAAQKVDQGLDRMANKIDGPGGIGKKVDNSFNALNSDAEDIRETLAQLTDNALSEDGLDNLRMRLVDADRNRISKLDLSDEQEKAFETKVKAFRDAWKARYNEAFDAEDHEDEYLKTALVEEGEFGKNAQLASEVKKNSETATQTGRGDKNAAGNTKADENLDDGRNIAVVTLAGMGGKDALRIPMIHELPDSWKVNVPDRVTGEILYTNLDKTLTKIMDKQSEWPSDKNQAYSLITYKVAHAILDCENDAMKKDTAMPATDLQKPNTLPGTNQSGANQSGANQSGANQPGANHDAP